MWPWLNWTETWSVPSSLSLLPFSVCIWLLSVRLVIFWFMKPDSPAITLPLWVQFEDQKLFMDSFSVCFLFVSDFSGDMWSFFVMKQRKWSTRDISCERVKFNIIRDHLSVSSMTGCFLLLSSSLSCFRAEYTFNSAVTCLPVWSCDL